MAKQKIYLDTSVISAFYDGRVPERQEQTKIFFADLNSRKVKTRRLVNLTNAVDGLSALEIIAPPEL